MMFVSRLLAVLEDIPDDWRWYDLSHLRARVVEDRLGIVRPMHLHATLLRRIEAASAPLSLNHAMRRVYAVFRVPIFPVLTPLLAKPSGSSRWGGKQITWSVAL